MVPEGPSTRANPARGIVLIVTALVLGLFVLRQGFETVDDAPAATSSPDSQEESGGADPDAEGTSGDGDGESATSAPTSEPQEEPLRDPSELTVRVVNTTTVVGTAANWTCFLQADYIADPGQATNLEGERDRTTVMYTEGLEREAAELAQKVGTDVGVEPVPAEPQLTNNQGEPLLAEGVQFLVLLGTDLAGNEPSSCEG